jgi:hypothetical protein
MKVTLVRPGYGSMLEGYRLNDGRMEPLSLALLAGIAHGPPRAIEQRCSELVRIVAGRVPNPIAAFTRSYSKGI